ncbi:MAG: histidinol-phosphatase [Bacteroidetes bacterium]|nr:histidinol-phosphatase [Bacteroidota bacterium]
MFSNYHTHTRFSDGSKSPEKYVMEAIRQEFEVLGFSDHAPLHFLNFFALKEYSLKKYCQRIKELKSVAGSELSVLLSLEIDYIPGFSKPFSVLKETCDLDYTVGSVHLVKPEKGKDLWFIDGPFVESYDKGLKKYFQGDIRLGVTTYYRQIRQMIVEEKPDIIGHIDKIKMYNRGRYFREAESWYQDLIEETIQFLKPSSSIVEVNTRGIYKQRANALYPSVDILKRLYEENIPVTISSDAHKPEEISACMVETAEILRKIGFREDMVNGFRAWRRITS